MATKTFPIVSAGALPKVLLVFLVGGFGGIAPTMLRIGVGSLSAPWIGG